MAGTVSITAKLIHSTCPLGNLSSLSFNNACDPLKVFLMAFWIVKMYRTLFILIIFKVLFCFSALRKIGKFGRNRACKNDVI
jgi:hypothetical protein